MVRFTLGSSRDEQKETSDILTSLLYKEGYCVCIPDPRQVELLLNEIDKSWIQTFLLEKNAIGLSVIPRFLLILAQNKLLNTEERDQLLTLIHLLFSQLRISDIDLIRLEKKEDSLQTLVEEFSKEAINRIVSDQGREESLSLNSLTSTKLVKDFTMGPKKIFFKPLRDYFNLFKPCFGLKDSEVSPLELNEQSPLIKHAF